MHKFLITRKRIARPFTSARDNGELSRCLYDRIKCRLEKYEICVSEELIFAGEVMSLERNFFKSERNVNVL